ncbi:MAG: hydantoinase B/oxoprolinase family protein [Actinomycetota bacterium]|nr:hydantoinase B/oxoprolinase family protein [Actinomycetota bacterium]
MTATESLADSVSVDIDPITFEVVRNKLAAITEEQAITLKRVSGSVIVVHATDFNNGTYLSDGSIVTMGPQVIMHTGTMSSVIRSIIDDLSENPGINKGDQFILNDPYKGAVHQPDVSIVSPIFYEGERIAWVGSCAHQLDVGGMVFGSWNTQATEIQQEAMLLPGVKLVESGELRHDLWQMIMGMTRMPQSVGLDLRAMIAANNVAEQRLIELMERYGADVVLSVMRTEIDTSERQFRARLSALPDGVFRSVDFIDGDGLEDGLHNVSLTIRKEGDGLVFDLAGTSPQAAGFINCTRSGLIGGLFNGLLPILAPDLRWNEGILRAVTLEAPEGIVCNATRPAPCSGGTISAAWVSMNAAVMAVARLAACALLTAGDSQAVSKGSVPVVPMSGLDEAGMPFGTMLLEGTAGGGGAGLGWDGLDPSGDFTTPRPSLGNVEDNEMDGPYLYLYRRLLTDTGGPGASRGGRSVGVALTPHGAASVRASLVGHGVKVPNSVGLFGGLEGATVEALLLHGNGNEPETAELSDPAAVRSGEAEVLNSKVATFQLERGDVFAWTSEGGGGYGDPLDREPARVAADIAQGIVSIERAEFDYGVVFCDGAVDEAQTAGRREAIRIERLSGRSPTREPAAMRLAPGEGPIGPGLKLDGQRHIRCGCGEDLGPAAENFKAAALTRIVDASRHGAHLVLHPELELREHICPACATLLESEVVRRGAPSLHTIEIH